MSRILKSLHGKELGIDHDGRLLCPNGLVLGNNGSQRLLGGPNVASLWDDFIVHGFNAATWQAVEGTDAATSAAAQVAGGMGGVLRLTTGDAGTGYAADAEQITQDQLLWQAANTTDGKLIYEIRVALSAITTCYAFLGFTDTIAAALEQPIFSAGSANTLTSSAGDAVGFMFDTAMDDDNWWLTGVANDVDATHQDTGFAPVAGDYEVLRIEVAADGSAVFYRNGTQVGTAIAGAITPSVALTPIFTVSKSSVAASMDMDIDYVHVCMDR